MTKLRFAPDLKLWDRHWKLILGAAAVLIAVLIVLDWLRALLFPFFSSAMPGGKISPLDIENSGKPAPVYDSFSASFSKRSLFSATQETSSTAPIPDADLAQFELAGILLGNQKQAIFRNQSSQESIFVSEGGVFGDFTLEQIKPKSVLVKKGSEEKEMVLEQ